MSRFASDQRIAGVSDADAPWWVRALFALQRRKNGSALGPTRVWARAAGPLRAFLHFVAAVDRKASPIDAGLRSLIMVRVSQLTRCHFCVDFNAARLGRRGVSIEHALALNEYRTSPLFTDLQRTALDYAGEMTRGSGQVTDGTFERLRTFFDDDAIVELTALVALQNASSRFNAALRIPSQGLCPGYQWSDSEEVSTEPGGGAHEE